MLLTSMRSGVTPLTRSFVSYLDHVLLRIASPAQCRAGRALLGLTQAEFARRARVSRRALSDHEAGVSTVSLYALRRITEALLHDGVKLIAPDGVRLRSSRAAKRPMAAGLSKERMKDAGPAGPIRLLQALAVLPRLEFLVGRGAAGVPARSANIRRRIVH